MITNNNNITNYKPDFTGGIKLQTSDNNQFTKASKYTSVRLLINMSNIQMWWNFVANYK